MKELTKQYGSRITSLETLSLGRFCPHIGANGFSGVCPRIRRHIDQMIASSHALEWTKISNPQSHSLAVA